MSESRTMIEIRGVGKSYGSKQILHDIDLTISQSEVVCIIGPSGSGKSTLLRVMALLETYEQGEVRIEGELLGFEERGAARVRQSAREVARVRRNVGFVFQQFNLWPHLTALENVAMPLVLARRRNKLDARQRAARMLEKVGLATRSDAYPAQLSGGQQQRVAIARALAAEPHIMLFDEPTSALDPELVGEVLLVMRELASEGMTMVVVTHEMRFAANVADRVVFLDHGRVLVDGSAKEVLQQPELPRLQQFLASMAGV